MRAADWCLSSAGAALVMATSSDPEHPAGNMADGSSETFWTTTGMFPQEFIIGFPKRVTISRVAIQCYLVRSLRIERSVSKDPVDFEECVEKEKQGRSTLGYVPWQAAENKSQNHRIIERINLEQTLKITWFQPENSVMLWQSLVTYVSSVIFNLQHTEGQLQMEEFPLPDFQATYLRFIIKSAFDHFVSVHRVMAEGTAEDT